jgi:hypothetical protein
MRTRSVVSGFCRCWIAVVVALASAIASANAQQYRSETPDKTSRAYGANARLWVTNPGIYAADKEHFKDYFEKYYFPNMTQADEADLGKLGDERYNLFKKFLWATNNSQLQQELTDLAFNDMRAIAIAKDPPYHPAVRYNAVLVLGMLDQQYGVDVGANRRAPIPLPKANEFLTLIVSYAAQDKQVPPPLVLSALIGLERHAQFHSGLDAQHVTAMTAALLRLVSHEQPIEDMDPDAYA